MPDDLITADSTETTTDSDGRTTVTGYQSDGSEPTTVHLPDNDGFNIPG